MKLPYAILFCPSILFQICLSDWLMHHRSNVDRFVVARRALCAVTSPSSFQVKMKWRQQLNLPEWCVCVHQPVSSSRATKCRLEGFRSPRVSGRVLAMCFRNPFTGRNFVSILLTYFDFALLFYFIHVHAAPEPVSILQANYISNYILLCTFNLYAVCDIHYDLSSHLYTILWK